MSKSPCTVRSLAAKLGLSPSTVAATLRGSSKFKPETVNRVRAAAALAGYRQNALLSSMMSEIRRCQVSEFKGVLAMLDMGESEREPPTPFYHRLVAGAKRRAAELGFKLESFAAGQTGPMTIPRLNSILETRDIRGLLLLPSFQLPQLPGLNWSRLAGVYTDYLMDSPALNSVCPDHFRGMMDVLRRVTERGYRRPGLFLAKDMEKRLDFHWSSAFLGWQSTHPEAEKVPILMTDQFDRVQFKRWFIEHNPDVVFGHDPKAVEWMRECGAEIPRTHGFVILNETRANFPCAGLDLQPDLIGARSMELLCGQVQRGELGVPAHPMISVLPPIWKDGPTLLDHSSNRLRSVA